MVTEVGSLDNITFYWTFPGFETVIPRIQSERFSAMLHRSQHIYSKCMKPSVFDYPKTRVMKLQHYTYNNKSRTYELPTYPPVESWTDSQHRLHILSKSVQTFKRKTICINNNLFQLYVDKVNKQCTVKYFKLCLTQNYCFYITSYDCL